LRKSIKPIEPTPLRETFREKIRHRRPRPVGCRAPMSPGPDRDFDPFGGGGGSNRAMARGAKAAAKACASATE
jgi:hypothetical protein